MADGTSPRSSRKPYRVDRPRGSKGALRPDRLSGPQAGRNYVGRWAEKILAERTGARDWPDTLPIPVPTLRDAVRPEETYSFTPDLWWAPHRAAVEMKAGSNRFYVTRRQLLGYQHLTREGPIPGLRVYYGFLPYRIPEKMDRHNRDSLDGAFHASLPETIPILDLPLVLDLAKRVGFWGRDSITPLSGLLGAWEDYARVTPKKLRTYLEAHTPTLRGPGWALYTWDPPSDPWVGPLPCEQAPLFFPPDPLW